MAYITINKNNFFHNLDLLSKKLGSKDKLAVVLKDNAYGHGIEILAMLSKEYGIKKAVVKDEDEALKIQNYFEEIIILNPSFENFEHKNIYKDNFSYVINSLENLQKITNQKALHLKIDSGMHRNGICVNEIKKALKEISQKKLNLKGVLTHFRSADDFGSDFFWQERNWKKIKNIVKKLCSKYNIPIPVFHSANSSTLLRKTKYEDDFARCGIAIYGYTHLDKIFGKFDLKPILKLYAKKISSRKLKKGSKIGYGGIGKLTKEAIVSTYDIGYGDGFFRNLYPNIIGRVSMDNISVISSQEEICILDDAYEIAKLNNTITYDILVKLKKNIKRIVV